MVWFVVFVKGILDKRINSIHRLSGKYLMEIYLVVLAFSQFFKKILLVFFLRDSQVSLKHKHLPTFSIALFDCNIIIPVIKA